MKTVMELGSAICVPSVTNEDLGFASLITITTKEGIWKRHGEN